VRHPLFPAAPSLALGAALCLVAGGCAHRGTQQAATPLVDVAGVAAAVPVTPPFDVVRDDPFFTTNRIDWPGPNDFRAASGMPGPRYWQQRADYRLEATLDTAAQSVSGAVTIRYTNNSPDTLRFVWLQLEQNLYRPGSLGSALFPADSRWGVRGFEGGYALDGLTVDGQAPAGSEVRDTRMRVDLARPIAPGGGVATIALRFRFRVPEHGSDRMARQDALYEMAQWYPRMAVYDDVRGWNVDPYFGQGEFYLEYGDYDVAITAPAGFTVSCSGTLQNAAEVLTAAQRERLARAMKSSTVVQVITAQESTPRAAPGTKTWRFRAENVRDVAWAASPRFRWDATSWNGVLAQALYEWPRAGRGWEDAAENTQWTIRTYSENVFPYPYPVATSVAGPVGGMEYPMMVFVHEAEEAEGAFGTIDHEHGHEWFPMIVGSNERRYAWMDEGFNTYINAFSNERRRAGFSAWPQYIANWKDTRERGVESPLMTRPDHIEGSALGAIGYRKPAATVLTLRNHVVGREAFDRAFREYVRRWAFKHPTPGDFFRTVENVTGEDLSWFWRGWMYTTDVLDLGIASVTTRKADDGSQVADIRLVRRTGLVFPPAMRLRLQDGTTQDVRLPVDVWRGGASAITVSVTVRGTVTGARLWPDPSVPDWDATNDTWGNAPAADALGPVTTGGLSTPVPGAGAPVNP
jgi:hypothetical protein